MTQVHIDEVSAVRIADQLKQPPHRGFPFVIHFPEAVAKSRLSPQVVKLIENAFSITRSQPIFLKTDLIYLRVAFHYGDAASASRVWDELATICPSMIFRNWIA